MAELLKNVSRRRMADPLKAPEARSADREACSIKSALLIENFFLCVCAKMGEKKEEGKGRRGERGRGGC